MSEKRSRIDENKQYWPPLGLAYIAAVLEEHNHKVKIIDRDLSLKENRLDFEKTDRDTLDLINSFNPEIVGFTVTTPNVSDANYVSTLIKKEIPKITTIIGGPHCIGEPILTLQKCPSIDILVRGEGENTMLEIANGCNLTDITGIVYRNKENIVSNPDRPVIQNLDSLPLPARHLLRMDLYLRPSRFTSRNLSLRTTHIFTARGCPYRCHYCAGPISFGGKVRYHSPERVVSEIDYLISEYSIEALYFAEDMFLANKKRARKMLSLFIEKGINKKIKWMAQLSTNIVDKEYLELMKDAGCVHVEYGFESGSQRILDLMNKKATVKKNLMAVNLTKEVGLRFQGNIITGYPGETEEDFHKTLDFLRKTKPHNIGFNLFMPLPGSFIYNKLKAEGKHLPDWDSIGDPEMSQIIYADMSKPRFEELYLKARFKIILPINLYYFIKDNIKNPLRMIYIGLTQFKGVVVKTIRAMMRLRKLKNTA
ncbi:MAG: radical SAM protein [Planctomycetota bacterium]|nr:radical SAM protein [Planctomycetota bacterium]MDI6787205.1 radical SAM protein [Planctomycetota bacterium]